MFFINKVTIQNIKGISSWTHTFDGLCANKVNLFVASNGFGKSTIAAAFQAAAHGRMKLQKGDYYDNNEENKPLLELEYTKDGETKTIVSDGVKGEVSRAFSIGIINNPVFAKSTGRSMGGYSTHSAELYVQDIAVCEEPPKVEIAYGVSNFKTIFGKGTLNLKDFLKSEDGLHFIIENKKDFGKCIEQTRLKATFEGITSENIEVEEIKKQRTIESLIEGLVEQFGLSDEDAIKYIIQIVYIMKVQGIETVQSAYAWAKYKKIKNLIDLRLQEFNTSGLELKTSKKNGKLILTFGRASRLSNGERDLLSFVVSLIVYESQLGRNSGILIIDEVFDYLDGANLLAAQYYLSQFLQRMKRNGRDVVSIIMTHLDPAVFSNYNFRGMAVHYLTSKSKIDLDDCIVKMIQLRSQLKSQKDAYTENYEKYLLHYHSDNWTIPEEILKVLPEDFVQDSDSLKNWLYRQVTERYLANQDYNALAVIIALRIKVEERIVEMLPEDKRQGFFDQHGSNNKLPYAEECGCEIPELFYLLQPLYNDPIHLRNGHGSERENKNKIESAYLKVDSTVVRKMISEVFLV